MSRPNSWREFSIPTLPGQKIIPGILLVLAVLLAYLPAWHGGFVWDDDSWTSNLLPLFKNADGLKLIWFQPMVLQQYYPLSATTFWLDYQLWKFWTFPYHIENILLHALAALLFWRLLLRLKLPGAGLAAALFALHPVMVESAAWITERKNVLSLVLFLTALLAYERYSSWVSPAEADVTAPESSRFSRYKALFYGLAFVLFLGALLAKTTAFCLPAVILLLAWWQRGKLRWREDVLPTLPFFAVSLALCTMTAWIEKNHVGAQGADFALSFPQRCLVAGHAFWFYLGKLLWPANLCFVYPRWQINAGAWWQWLYPIAAIGALSSLWLARERIGRGPLTALLFFAGSLLPVLGFMNAYGMLYSFVWDHWVYLSSLGIMALVATLVVQAAERLRQPMLVYGFAILVLPGFACLTWRQAGTFRNMETLWLTTLAKNPDCGLAHSDYAALLLSEGHNAAAVEQYRKAVQINPDRASTYFNLAYALTSAGELEEAVGNFQKAIQIDPEDADTRLGYGIVLSQLGRTKDAIIQYREALKLNPNLADALNNLAWILAASSKDGLRNGNEAVALAERACELTHESKPLFVGTLAAAYAEAGMFPDAVSTAEKAAQLATSAGLTNVAAKNRQLEALYQAGKPFHESPPVNPTNLIPEHTTSDGKSF